MVMERQGYKDRQGHTPVPGLYDDCQGQAHVASIGGNSKTRAPPSKRAVLDAEAQAGTLQSVLREQRYEKGEEKKVACDSRSTTFEMSLSWAHLNFPRTNTRWDDCSHVQVRKLRLIEGKELAYGLA